MARSYLVRQLRNFRGGVRGSHPSDQLGQVMRTMVGTLPDDQAILDVVAYIATSR